METGNRDDLLTLEDVRCHFPVRQGMLGEVRHLRAVDGVDLVLRPGQSLGLVGESGCGKSTLGRLACGLQRPTGGRILFRGAPLPPAGAGSMAAGHIQMVFQDPFSSLDPRCTVGTSVEESLLAGVHRPSSSPSFFGNILFIGNDLPACKILNVLAIVLLV